MRSLVERFLAEAPVKRIQTKSLEDYLIKRLTLQGYWQSAASPAFAEHCTARRRKPPQAH